MQDTKLGLCSGLIIKTTKIKGIIMLYTDDADGAAERLESIAALEGSEHGRVWEYLSALWISYVDYLSPAMQKALKDELISEAERSHRDYILEEVTHVRSEVRTHLLPRPIPNKNTQCDKQDK
jgi:hypothetical protein